LTKITISIYYNNTSASNHLYCIGGGGDWGEGNEGTVYLTLADGTNVFPIKGEGFCGQNPNWSVDPNPGDVIELFDVFPPLSAATQPFTYTYTIFGTVDGIILVK
jgi:hypothetical protein